MIDQMAKDHPVRMMGCWFRGYHNPTERNTPMPRGDKSAYSDKQQRQAEHIEEGYESRGTPPREAAGRAWATVNKMTGGGKKRGSGRGRRLNRGPARKGGRIGSRSVSHATRVRAGRKAARTRKARAR
jgi:plasmid stabilization system protein ParE